MSIKKTQKLIDLAKKGGNNADLYILQLLEELESKLEKLDEKMPDLGMFLANVRGEDGVSIEEIEYEDGTLTIKNSEGEEYSWYVKGEDAEITEELKEELVSKVQELIKIPNLDSIVKDLNSKIEQVAKMKNVVEVKETVIEREVIDDSTIEKLKEDNKNYLEELSKKITEQFPTDAEIRQKIKEIMPVNPPDYAGGSGATFLKALRDVDTKDRSTTKAYLKWNPTTKKYEHVELQTGGSSVSVNGAEVADPDFLDSSTIQLGVAGSNVTPSVKLNSSAKELLYNDGGTAINGAENVTIESNNIAFKDTTTTPSKVTGKSVPVSETFARPELVLVTNYGIETRFDVTPTVYNHKVWLPNGNGTTISLLGAVNLPTGTATTRNVATTNYYTQHIRIGYVSTAVAGNSAGTRHGSNQWRVGGSGRGGFTFRAKIGIQTNQSNQRGFVGMTSSGAVIGNVDPSTLLNMCGFAFDSGDTNWRFMHNDSSGAATEINLGASFPTNTNETDVYLCEIYSDVNASSSEVFYRITRTNTGDTAFGSVTTDLPSTSTLLSPQIWLNNGSTAAAVGIDVMGWDIYTDY